MGQRFVQLDSSYTGYAGTNTATLHVSQVPPNAAILAPGPALIFVVINDTPSVGTMIMVGSGSLGPQAMLPVADLPESSIVQPQDTTSPTKHSGSPRTHTGHWYIRTLIFSVFVTFFNFFGDI
jgi:Domain of unknown function (DUF1929)